MGGGWNTDRQGRQVEGLMDIERISAWGEERVWSTHMT